MAVGSTGSRAGLITSLVIFVILFFITGVMWIVEMNNAKKAVKDLADNTKRYRDVIKDSEMNDQDYQVLQNLRSQPGNADRSLFELLLDQRQTVTQQITGDRKTETKKTVDTVAASLQAAGKTIKDGGVDAQVPAGSLLSAIGTLSAHIVKIQSEKNDLETRLKATQEDMKNQVATYAKELDQHKKSVQTADSRAAAADQSKSDYQQTKDKQITDLEKNLADTIEKHRKAVEEMDTQIKQAKADLAKLVAERDRLNKKLITMRPRNVAEPITRRPDGKIIQVAQNGICYIDLGQGQQITAGMTFEVYDRNEGIPRAESTSSDEALPVGKASLEVVKVSQDSSECRVIKLQPGARLFEGDLIANLIYDRNTRFTFHIFGKFDIDQNNVASTSEADVIKRLVVQWGSALTDKVDIDTDFLVMGKEPIVPNTPKEELESNAILKFEYDKAVKELQEYDAIRNKAIELGIPVLNQNRFLYLIGFFDQAKR